MAPESNSPRVWRVLTVALAAAGLNSMDFEIAGGAIIFAGAFAYMPLVLLLPWTWAVPVAAIATLPTYLISGYPFAYFISVAEAIWIVSMLKIHRGSALLLDLTFWIVVGLPVGSWFMLDISRFPSSIGVLILAKQVIVQLSAVGFGHFVITHTRFGEFFQNTRRSGRRLRDLVFSYLFVLAAVPLALVTVGFSLLVRQAADKEDERVLGEAAVRVARELDLFLQVHRESIVVAANLIESEAGGRPGRVLAETRRAHPAFLTLLEADRDGIIREAAPANLLALAGGSSVADRDYFRRARDTKEPQVSGAFRGRGFGTDLLVAVSAPLHGADGSFDGVVQGAVQLADFGRLVVEAGQLDELEFIVADSTGRVIYASPDAGAAPLSNVLFHPLGSFLHQLPLGPVVYNLPDRAGRLRGLKAVAVRSGGAGLLVVAQRPQLAGMAGMVDFYVLLAGIAGGVFATAIVVARAAGRRLSLPLEHFSRATEAQAARGEVDVIDPPPRAALPQEVELVYTAFNYLALSLRETYDELVRANTVLDQRVAERTRQLQAAYDSKSAFLATTSHEIRTPLNAIIGLTEVLLEQPLPNDATDKLRTIRNSGVLLLDVVNDLLDLSQAEAGRLQLRPAPVEIGAVCREVCGLFEVRARRQGLALSLELAAEPSLWVETDGQRLRQVLINLLGNALKFTRAGSVRLRCESAAEAAGESLALHFSVIDTGPGIPADKQARLFEPYYRVENADTRGIQGTGLGLTISRNLVSLLGGTLRVTSVAGRGSDFHFSIPVARVVPPARPVAVAPEPAGKSGLSSLSVMAADDNPANLEVLRALLEDRCARLVVTDSGDEALSLLGTERFDVALLDLEMPGLDGFGVVRALRAKGEQAASWACRVLAVSAHSGSELQSRCAGAGFDGWVEKPINRAELFRAIEGSQTGSANTSAASTDAAAAVASRFGFLENI